MPFTKRMRVWLTLLLTLCLASALLYAQAGNKPPPLSARAAILLDAKTGQVLFNKNMHSRQAPASTTKILTAILAIESQRLDELVTISRTAAAVPGSSLHLTAGQQLTLQELLTGLLLRSGNDAATAIAEHLAGSSELFVQNMNEKAQQLGLTGSHFMNPSGLSAAGHYTTAFDLAQLARYAMDEPLFANLVTIKETSIEWQDRRGASHDRSLRNTNKLLWLLPEADGIKTGTTSEAGPCLVASATRDAQKLIAVVLHAPNRWQDAQALLTYGFNQYTYYEAGAADDVITPLPVQDGFQDMVDAQLATAAACTLPTEQIAKLQVAAKIPPIIKAPVYQGQKVGELVFTVEGQTVATFDLIAGESVEEKTYEQIVLRSLVTFIGRLAAWGTL